VCRINPLLEEIELNEKINSIMCIEEIPYILQNPKLKEEKLRKIEKAWNDIDNSTLSYSARTRMFPKIYSLKFILGLKEGNDYLQLLASGGLGFVLGIITDEVFRSYVRRVSKEFFANLPQYSKS